MDAETEVDLLISVCKRLENAGIKYMLTGSFALNYYAVPRMTRDIDIVIQLNKLDVDGIFEHFENDFYFDRDVISNAIETRGMFNIIHNPTVLKFDFIVRKNATYRRTEFERRRRVDMGNAPIWIVSPEDLVISKLMWAKDSLSQMQLKDIRNLMDHQKDIDREYINEWINELGLSSVYEKVKDHG